MWCISFGINSDEENQIIQMPINDCNKSKSFLNKMPEVGKMMSIVLHDNEYTWSIELYYKDSLSIYSKPSLKIK